MLRTLTLTCLIVSLLAGCVSVSPGPTLLGSHGMALTDVDSCAENPGETWEGGLDPDGFSVTSWNIYKQQLDGWNSDLDRLAYQSDILMLQEASLQPDLQTWLGEQFLEWDMSPAFTYRGASAGVMTLGTYPAGANCSHLQSEPWLRIPKAVLASYYPIEGHDEALLVINIHAVNFTFGTNDLESQLYQADEYLAAHGGPVVLAGDFNTWSQPRLIVLENFAARHGLQMASYEGQQPALHWGSAVDHVLFRDLTVLDSRVRAVESSDHYPLQVRFALPHRL